MFQSLEEEFRNWLSDSKRSVGRRSREEIIAYLCWREALVIVGAAIVAKLIYVDLILQQHQSMIPYFGPSLVLALLQNITFREMRLHELETLKQPVIGFGAILGGLCLSFLVLIGGLYLLKTAEFYSRGWFLVWAMFAAAGMIWVRSVTIKETLALQRVGRLRQRVALVGTADYLEELNRRLAEELDYHIVAQFTVDDPNNAEVLFNLEGLQSASDQDQIDRIIIGAAASEVSLIRSIVKQLSAFDREVLLCSSLEKPIVSAQSLATFSDLRFDVVNGLPRSSANYALKRGIDYCLSLLALILLLPILLGAAIAIRLTSQGPIIFKQRRLGLNNRTFFIYKFRTMSVMEDDRVQQAQRDDPRVTTVGRWLRASSIDELPQLINVLKGDMSLVGPRPHAIAHDQEFERKFDIFGRRRRVRPGLTGWAQVNGCRGATPTDKDVRDRMNFDLYYIENWSIWLDLEILCRTVTTVARGAY